MPLGSEEQVMGEYYPRGRYFRSAAEFERLGCRDLGTQIDGLAS